MRRTMKIFSIVMVLCMLFTSVSFASTGTQTEKITYRTIGIQVNGTEIAPCDVSGKSTEPFIRNADSSTYLPVRAVAGALGLDVDWNDSTNTVILKSGGKVITGSNKPVKTAKEANASLTYRNIKITLDGKNVTLKNAAGGNVEPFIMNGSTYIPVRAVAEALGCEVGWDGDKNMVTLKKIIETPAVEALKATASINVTMPIDKTQAFTLSAKATGGIAPYTYQWYWGTSTGNYHDMSTYASFDTSSATLTAKPDARYNTQYMRCKITDKAGTVAYTNDIKITLKEEAVVDPTPVDPTPVDPTPSVTKQVEPSVTVKDIPWKAAAVDSSGNPTVKDVTVKQYTFTFSTVPTNYDEIIQYKLDSPYKTMALAFLAFRTWTPDNPTDCYQMMDYLTNTAAKKSNGEVYKFSEYNSWTQFMKDRMMQNGKYRFIGNAYLKGATPANNYTPTKPITITLRESTYVPYQKATASSPETYQVLISLDGADNERYSILYKHSNGDWKFFSDNWKGLLVDIKTPAMDSLY